MSSLILIAFILTFPTRPTTAWQCQGCKDVFDNFSPCSSFVEGRCNDPSPLCCQNIENFNNIADQDGPTRTCKCIEYFAIYKARNPFNVSQIQELPFKCNKHLSFPISEHMDCSRWRDDEEWERYISRRRILTESRYISYGAMRGDSIPCGRRGNSYYNCQSHERANPYNRGCMKITHCQRNNRRR